MVLRVDCLGVYARNVARAKDAYMLPAISARMERLNKSAEENPIFYLLGPELRVRIKYIVSDNR